MVVKLIHGLFGFRYKLFEKLMTVNQKTSGVSSTLGFYWIPQQIREVIYTIGVGLGYDYLILYEKRIFIFNFKLDFPVRLTHAGSETFLIWKLYNKENQQVFVVNNLNMYLWQLLHYLLVLIININRFFMLRRIPDNSIDFYLFSPP